MKFITAYQYQPQNQTGPELPVPYGTTFLSNEQPVGCSARVVVSQDQVVKNVIYICTCRNRQTLVKYWKWFVENKKVIELHSLPVSSIFTYKYCPQIQRVYNTTSKTDIRNHKHILTFLSKMNI